MAPELTNEAWAQIRYDYEHSDRPLGDICAEHGISSGTLRDRVRRWGWTRRRLPIPFEGPPPAPPVDMPPFPAAQAFDAAPPAALPPSETPPPAASPYIAMDGDEAGALPPSAAYGEGLGEDGKPGVEPNNGAIVPRLQSAVARVLPAIEATVARLAAGPTHPREMERAGRALASLTRTLRELTGLLERHRANVCLSCGSTPRSTEELRASLARKLEALVARQQDEDSAATGEGMAEAGAGAKAQPEAKV